MTATPRTRQQNKALLQREQQVSEQTKALHHTNGTLQRNRSQPQPQNHGPCERCPGTGRNHDRPRTSLTVNSYAQAPPSDATTRNERNNGQNFHIAALQVENVQRGLNNAETVAPTMDQYQTQNRGPGGPGRQGNSSSRRETRSPAATQQRRHPHTRRADSRLKEPRGRRGGPRHT